MLGKPVLSLRGPAFRLGQGRCHLTTVSSHPGWPCSTGTATWWITCPSRSSTTFSRANCTSTPRASSRTASAPLSPRPPPTRWPLQSLSVPPFLSCLSVSPSPRLDCSPHLLTQPSTVWGTCREPQHTLFGSHLWTDSPLISGPGWVRE